MASRDQKRGDDWKAPVVAVIGDDLSGVVSVGGELASRGLATMLPRELEDLHTDPISNSGAAEASVGTAVVVTTDSRHDRPDVARKKVLAATTTLSSRGAKVLVKKVDSLLRGNIGVELAAAIDGTGAEKALCIFAAPSQGRTTVGGVQRVDGEPVGAEDPGSFLRFASREASITGLLREEFGDRVRSLGLETVETGRGPIRERLRTLLEDHPGAVVVCDATQGTHVADCVAAALSTGFRLFAGTSDLCGTLTDALVAEGRVPRPPPVLIVSGTASRQGLLQLEHFALKGEGRLIQTPAKPSGSGGTEAYARQAATHLNAGENVVLCPERAWFDGEVEASPEVARSLAEVGTAALREARVCGIIAMGGETAEAVLDLLGAGGLAVGRDVIPGVPEAVVVGGPHAGLRFVAKTGSFGAHDALREIAGWLRSRNELFDASLRAAGPPIPPGFYDEKGV